MGIYDRDYFREDDDYDGRPRRKTRSRGGIPFGLSGVALLIITNVALYFINQGTGSALFEKMALSGALAQYPLQWYRCLTYGFAHDPSGLMHILCNMLVLFFFGPPIEQKYGRREFLWFYFCAVVFGGVVWNILNFGANSAALGASGAISALVILFAMNYPKAQVLIFGILPTPAWLAGVAIVLYDAFGVRGGFDNVAHDVHLSGAAFAFVYFLLKINFSELSIGRGRNKKSLKKLFSGGSRSKKTGAAASSNSTVDAPSRWSFGKKNENLTVKDPAFEQMEAEVDRLLFKISEQGEESLTESERETLRRASREYQKRQKKD